jgi:hypothetical protein
MAAARTGVVRPAELLAKTDAVAGAGTGLLAAPWGLVGGSRCVLWLSAYATRATVDRDLP